MWMVGLGEVKAYAFGTKRERAAGVDAEVQERIFGMIVAIHNCYNY